MKKIKWQCKVAPSLGALEDTHENIWHTRPYLNKTQASVFFGLYGLPDFYKLWRHKGRKAILWAGSDIHHFINGYWLDNNGRIKIEPQQLAEWINENCESYVENGVEHEALQVMRIESKIIPSFLGNIDDYNIEYQWNERPQVYASVSGDNFAMYGWELIEMIADQCNVDFHLYGNTLPWESKHSNIFVHGRIPKTQMNEEIKTMQCGLRVLEFDGFSEVLAKSVLWGQHPISRIAYPYIESFTGNDELIRKLNTLVNRKEPNTEARNYYKKTLNAYPWNN